MSATADKREINNGGEDEGRETRVFRRITPRTRVSGYSFQEITRYAFGPVQLKKVGRLFVYLLIRWTDSIKSENWAVCSAERECDERADERGTRVARNDLRVKDSSRSGIKTTRNGFLLFIG